MKYRKPILALLITLLVFSLGCENKKDGKDEIAREEDPVEKEEIGDKLLDRIKSMTLREKLGQLIIVGFDGTDVNEETEDYIQNLKVGGFILFARNIKDKDQTLNLLNNLKLNNSNNDHPLFLAIDEEGGRVSRLSKEFMKIPEAMTIGDKNDPSLSYQLGEILGQRIRSLGFNMNFAPVLDINSNPDNPVIGRRSFGIRPETVWENGIEVINGLRNVDVIPTVKHFPGHGDTSVDSHVNLPKVNKTREELREFELVPFRRAIEERVEMIMIAHILYPQIDETNPATMSKEIIGGLLRGELDYQGVIVSDDMTMGAIVENYTLEDAVVSFIEAGGDIALVCHGRENPKRTIEKLEEAVKAGRISEEDLDQKVYRILKLKEKFELEDNIIEEVDLREINKRTEEFIKEVNK